MADLSRGEAPEVTGTIYLSSEGVSRLSRDQDRIVGPQLLKLMKQANCRVRTPYAIFNPGLRLTGKSFGKGLRMLPKRADTCRRNTSVPKRRQRHRRGSTLVIKFHPASLSKLRATRVTAAISSGNGCPTRLTPNWMSKSFRNTYAATAASIRQVKPCAARPGARAIAS